MTIVNAFHPFAACIVERTPMTGRPSAMRGTCEAIGSMQPLMHKISHVFAYRLRGIVAEVISQLRDVHGLRGPGGRWWLFAGAVSD